MMIVDLSRFVNALITTLMDKKVEVVVQINWNSKTLMITNMMIYLKNCLKSPNSLKKIDYVQKWRTKINGLLK